MGQNVQMLHDRRQRDRERLGELADREAWLLREPHHERTPRRIGKSREGAIKGRLGKLNHLVKFSRNAAAVNRGS
jgi:hypothetical protein